MSLLEFQRFFSAGCPRGPSHQVGASSVDELASPVVGERAMRHRPCCSSPSASYRPRSSEPTAGSARCRRGLRAVPEEHDVGGSRVLDLEHRALVGLSTGSRVLGHDAVEPGAFEPLEPVASQRGVVGVDARGERAGGPVRAPARGALPCASPAARRGASRPRGRAGRTPRTTPASRSTAFPPGTPPGARAAESASQLEPVVDRHDDLAVEHALVGQVDERGRDDLGEVAGQLLVAAAARAPRRCRS